MSCSPRILAISRTATLEGWIVIGVVFLALVVAAIVSHRKFPDGLALLRVTMRNRACRVFVLIGWVWLGWHFFVRTSR